MLNPREYVRSRALRKAVKALFAAAVISPDPHVIHPKLVDIARRFNAGGLFVVTLAAADFVKRSSTCTADGVHQHQLMVVTPDGDEVDINDVPAPARTAMRIMVAHASDDRSTVEALFKAAAEDGPEAAIAVAGTATMLAVSHHGHPGHDEHPGWA